MYVTDVTVENYKLFSCFTKGASRWWCISSKQAKLLYVYKKFNCGLGDVHNIISIQIKGNESTNKKELKTYRSFKNFDQENCISDLKDTDFDNVLEHDDVNKMHRQHSKFEQARMKAVNKHAPLETRKPCPQPAPFTNKERRKIVYKKKNYITVVINTKRTLIGNYTENKEIW